jgi:thiamine kinase-like enzyme
MESGISLEELNGIVAGYFRQNASRYLLRPEALSVHYILNWGGFVNASFTIQDGRRAYHLKLADYDEGIENFDKWYELRAVLEGRYRAPKIVDWIEIEDTPFEGLLFQQIEGRKANFLAEPQLHGQVLKLVSQLHADRELALALEALNGEPAGSCADYFISTYIDRFDEDLLTIARDLPPFVSLPTLDWMQGETRHMESLAREHEAFWHPAAAPTHGDLWENNILVQSTGEWSIIDWDDLALGDPALEYSILVSPVWRQNPQADLKGASLLPEGNSDPRLQERLAVCLQAYLLDEVIDTLADYVEAEFAPEHQEVVKAEKKQRHLAAMALYRRLY